MKEEGAPRPTSSWGVRKPLTCRILAKQITSASLSLSFSRSLRFHIFNMQAVFSISAAAPVACANVKAAQAPIQVKAVAPRMAVAPKAAVSNVVSARQMLVWEPVNNK
jgi:hypothetical protein